MYARNFTFKTIAENRKIIEELADEIFSYTKSLQGFVSATYTVSEDETEYGSFTIWETKEDAIAAGASIREKVMPRLEGIVTAPPVISVMEVYEPKS
ncbi:MAG: hypothetical protein OEQ39_03245 [Gammaproteobacteria bacterium]|nr:hypothetical protein [Gammaproteobacteria bacterium]